MKSKLSIRTTALVSFSFLALLTIGTSCKKKTDSQPTTTDSGCPIGNSRISSIGLFYADNPADTTIKVYSYGPTGMLTHISNGATQSTLLELSYPDAHTVVGRSPSIVNVVSFNAMGELSQQVEYQGVDTDTYTTYYHTFNAAHQLLNEVSQIRRRGDGYQSVYTDSTVYTWQNGDVIRLDYYHDNAITTHREYEYWAGTNGKQFCPVLMSDQAGYLNRPGTQIVLPLNLVRKVETYSASGQLVDSTIYNYQLDSKEKMTLLTWQYYSYWQPTSYGSGSWAFRYAATQLFKYDCL